MAFGAIVPLAAEGHGHPEIPNLFTVINEWPVTQGLAETAVIRFLTAYQNEFFSLLSAAVVSLLVIAGSRRISQRPGRFQNALEAVVEAFDNFVCGVLGKKHGRRFLPYLGTLFIFIFINNIFGLVPFMKSSTSWIATTAALAICTFLIVQITAVVEHGPLGYLYHLSGEPNDPITWCLVPLFLPLHIIGELAKPLSLALRLFGNIMGEDILLGAFLMFGMAIAALVHLDFIGLPLHLPFMFLALLTSTIQALVFMLLSMIYILMVLPHHEEEHG